MTWLLFVPGSFLSSESPNRQEKVEDDLSGPQSIGPQMGVGQSVRAFQEMFKEALEGGCVEVRASAELAARRPLEARSMLAPTELMGIVLLGRWEGRPWRSYAKTRECFPDVNGLVDPCTSPRVSIVCWSIACEDHASRRASPWLPWLASRQPLLFVTLTRALPGSWFAACLGRAT